MKKLMGLGKKKKDVKSTFGSTASTEITKQGGIRKAPARLFNIAPSNGTPTRVYCDLDLTTPGNVATHIVKKKKNGQQKPTNKNCFFISFKKKFFFNI